VGLSDDLEYYVRTTNKGRCTIHRVADGTEVAQVPEPSGPPLADAGFGSGRLVAVRRLDYRFQLWDMSGPRPRLRFEAPNQVVTWHFRDDGAFLALQHADNSISVYDVAKGECLHRFAASDRAAFLLLHPTGPYLAAYSYVRPLVQVLDWRTGAVVASATFSEFRGWVHRSGAWSPDGRTLTVPDGDSGKIQQYAFDPVAPALRPTRLLEGQLPPTDIAYSPMGDRIVSHVRGGPVRMFDAVSGQLLFTTPSFPSASLLMLRFDRTGQRLAGARVGERNDRLGLWSVADAREYRALVHAGNAIPIDETGTLAPAAHPGGRLAAVSLTDGVALFDLESGRELAHLPCSGRIPRTTGTLGPGSVTFDGTGCLLTNGFEGCFRWPVRSDAVNPHRLIVGPPARLPFHTGNQPISASDDGRVVAQCLVLGFGTDTSGGGWILHPNAPVPRQVPPRQVQPDVSFSCCRVSPDGRWVAFGWVPFSQPILGVVVFDAATGQRVWLAPTPTPGPNECCFSRDGRWLVTTVDGGRLYAAGTWEPGPPCGPGRPWDATAQLAVLGQPNGIYRLVELATGRELARLEDPEQNDGKAALTPDGTKLIVAAPNGLRVWDLRRIRAELAKLGLDWEAPPYPPAQEKTAQHPLEVTVNLGPLAPPR
jgi:WD40 repeat protein